jgi:hypothetical protein
MRRHEGIPPGPIGRGSRLMQEEKRELSLVVI